MKMAELLKQYNFYSKKEDYQKALDILLEANQIESNDPWILTNISSSYYELKKYATALSYSELALKITPMDPLVRWDYAGALIANDRTEEAVKVWKSIINRGINNIAYKDCKEGLRWAKSLYNDCYYRIGHAYYLLDYYKSSIYYLKKHLKLRQRGIPSLYKKTLVLKYLKKATEAYKSK